MDEFSLVIGGKAGFGIDKSSFVIAKILNQLGYRIYVYRDYPSIIRGGHTFSVVRASKKKVASSSGAVDFLLALDQETIALHEGSTRPDTVVIYDSDSAKSRGIGVPAVTIVKDAAAPDIVRNSCIIGAFCKVLGIEWAILEKVFRLNFKKEIELNLKVARRGFDEAQMAFEIPKTGNAPLPLLTGNDAIALGLIEGGLDFFVCYPMTPTSPILHFLAEEAAHLPITVLHPEGEIAVILMAEGAAYCGKRAAVATSGGGFCLMTEGLSLAGMAEIPITIILGQRPGPSTGLPTYSSQTELNFALSAGQGEFPRFVVAPGDPEEAFFWSSAALEISWRCQVPAIVLVDKELCEGTFSFDKSAVAPPGRWHGEVPLWDKAAPYLRYAAAETGISPLAFPATAGAVVKANSYEHDESGLTTEDPVITAKMHKKRLGKALALAGLLADYPVAALSGAAVSEKALVSWGSNKGVSEEAALALGMRLVRPLVLSPFPKKEMKNLLKGVRHVTVVENNATGQLAALLEANGIAVHRRILKYDGRPFTVDSLKAEIGKEA